MKMLSFVATPSSENFKSLNIMGMIKNIPVPVEDINIAEKNSGPSIHSMKGKTTRQKAKIVINDTIEIP